MSSIRIRMPGSRYFEHLARACTTVRDLAPVIDLRSLRIPTNG
jgi:hypothetical protein